jgi:hypothetical protein
MLLLA